MGLFSGIKSAIFGSKPKEISPTKIWPKNVTPSWQKEYAKNLSSSIGGSLNNLFPTLGNQIPFSSQQQQSLGLLGNYLGQQNPDYSGANNLVNQWMQPQGLSPEAQKYMNDIINQSKMAQQLGAHNIAQQAQLFGGLNSSGIGNALGNYYAQVEPQLASQLSNISYNDLLNRQRLAQFALPYSMQLAQQPQNDLLKKIGAGMQYGAAPYNENVRARNEQLLPMNMAQLPLQYSPDYLYPKMSYPSYSGGSSGLLGGMAGGIGTGIGSALGKLI